MKNRRPVRPPLRLLVFVVLVFLHIWAPPFSHEADLLDHVMELATDLERARLRRGARGRTLRRSL